MAKRFNKGPQIGSLQYPDDYLSALDKLSVFSVDGDEEIKIEGKKRERAMEFFQKMAGVCPALIQKKFPIEMPDGSEEGSPIFSLFFNSFKDLVEVIERKRVLQLNMTFNDEIETLKERLLEYLKQRETEIKESLVDTLVDKGLVKEEAEVLLAAIIVSLDVN